MENVETFINRIYAQNKDVAPAGPVQLHTT